MTKAPTVAARRGRKRKQAAREPGGRPQRENTVEILATVIDRRMRVMGWSPTDANRQRARDARLETLPGRLFLSASAADGGEGMLSEREYLGLTEYAQLHGRYLSAIGAPRPWPKCGTMGEPTGPTPRESTQEHVRRVTNAFMAAEGALLAAQAREVVGWLFEQPDDVGPNAVPPKAVVAAKRAGRLLADHFVID